MSVSQIFRDEAVALRRARKRVRDVVDPLAERARLLALWRSCPWPRPARNVFWRPFILKRAYWRLLMPGLRAHLEARERAKREQYEIELRQSIQREREKKAARTRASQPQVDWLEENT